MLNKCGVPWAGISLYVGVTWRFGYRCMRIILHKISRIPNDFIKKLPLNGPAIKLAVTKSQNKKRDPHFKLSTLHITEIVSITLILLKTTNVPTIRKIDVRIIYSSEKIMKTMKRIWLLESMGLNILGFGGSTSQL